LKIPKRRPSSRRAQQAKGKEEKTEKGQREGTDIRKFFDRHSENKKKQQKQKCLEKGRRPRDGIREVQRD
jgi:hypothetical protein